MANKFIMLLLVLLWIINDANGQYLNQASNMPAEDQQRLQKNLEILLNYLNDANEGNDKNSPVTQSLVYQNRPITKLPKYVSKPVFVNDGSYNLPQRQYSVPNARDNQQRILYNSPMSADSTPVSLRKFGNFEARIPQQLPYNEQNFLSQRDSNMAKVRWLRSQSREAPLQNTFFNNLYANEEIEEPRNIQFIPMQVGTMSQNGATTINDTPMEKFNEGVPINEIGDLELRSINPLLKDKELPISPIILPENKGLKFSKLGKAQETIPPPTESLKTESPKTTVNSNKPDVKGDLPPTQPEMNSVKKEKNGGGQVISSSLLPKTPKKNGKPRGNKPKPTPVKFFKTFIVIKRLYLG